MRDPVELRKRAGVTADTSRDQYFLEDARVLERMVGYAREAEFSLEHVLEIGPGTGALTARLLAHATRVTVIERDSNLADFIEREFAHEIETDQLDVVHGDALDVPLPSFSSCISNLPYGISSEIIFRVLPAARPLLVMVQREFGERMAADPGTSAYGRLSVTSQHFGDVEIREIVPPGVFTPPPPVDSAIVQIIPHPPAYALVDEEQFFAVVRALFTQRRKTVRNGIRNTGHISGIDDPTPVLAALPDSMLGKRPEALSPEEFARIANVVAEERSS